VHVDEVRDVPMIVDVVVTVGTGAGDGAAVLDFDLLSVVVSSLHPNQPGVRQIVELEVVSLAGTLVLEVEMVVVVSSRHPHHPGVLHVVVRVYVVEEEELELVMFGSVPLLSKYSQLKQSVQFGYGSHLGGDSYFSITSWMTLLMR